MEGKIPRRVLHVAYDLVIINPINPIKAIKPAYQVRKWVIVHSPQSTVAPLYANTFQPFCPSRAGAIQP